MVAMSLNTQLGAYWTTLNGISNTPCYVYKVCSLVITVLTFYAILYNDTGLKGTLKGLVCILSITLIQLAHELQNLLKPFSNNCLLTTVSQVLVKV